MSISYVAPNLPGTQAIGQLMGNDLILDGKTERALFNKKELDALYGTYPDIRGYQREIRLGGTLANYTNWTHITSDTGYSVWSYPVSGFIGNVNNEMYQNDVKLTYMGSAASESTLLGFNKVFWCNAKRSGATYTDYTTEATSVSGTAFTMGGYTAVNGEVVSGVLSSTKNLVYTNIINGTVTVYHGTSAFTENTDFTMDYTNGKITFLNTGKIPNGTQLNLNYNAGYVLYVGSSGLFTSMNIQLADTGVANRYTYTFSSAAGWNNYAPTLDSTNQLANNGTITWNTLTGWAKQTVNSSNQYWIRMSVVYPGVVYPDVYYIVKAAATATKLVAMSQTDINATNYKWCYFNNKVYVAVPNAGDLVNEGVTYVKSSSTNGVKLNYFVYNNTYLTNYKITPSGDMYIPGNIRSSGYYAISDTGIVPVALTGSASHMTTIVPSRNLANYTMEEWDIIRMQNGYVQTFVHVRVYRWYNYSTWDVAYGVNNQAHTVDVVPTTSPSTSPEYIIRMNYQLYGGDVYSKLVRKVTFH